MEALVKAKRIGGSLGVIIPKEIVKQEKILEEDTLNIKVEKTDNLNFLWEKYKGIKMPTDQIMKEIDENEDAP